MHHAFTRRTSTFLFVVAVALAVVGTTVVLTGRGSDTDLLDASARFEDRADTGASADDPLGGSSQAHVAQVAAEVGVIEVHRSAGCDCCGGHIDHLTAAGFEVEDVVHADNAEMTAFKRTHGVPGSMWSCHTTLVDGYTVEGHVPAAVIAELVGSRPDVDGVALPGMPAGSPGMDGDKNERWTFATFRNAEPSGVLTEW